LQNNQQSKFSEIYDKYRADIIVHEPHTTQKSQVKGEEPVSDDKGTQGLLRFSNMEYIEACNVLGLDYKDLTERQQETTLDIQFMQLTVV